MDDMGDGGPLVKRKSVIVDPPGRLVQANRISQEIGAGKPIGNEVLRAYESCDHLHLVAELASCAPAGAPPRHGRARVTAPQKARSIRRGPRKGNLMENNRMMEN